MALFQMSLRDKADSEKGARREAMTQGQEAYRGTLPDGWGKGKEGQETSGKGTSGRK